MSDCAQISIPLIYQKLFNPATFLGLVWEELRPGIDISRVYSAEQGAVMAFLRYAPGAALGRHVHAGYEHILILHGSQVDDRGEHSAGTLLVHPPGTSHGVTSPGGCIVLAYWEKPVQFL